ncbi:MAG: dihydroxy-acid dehydratase, partial [Firmicutes bacterium]|nr:dihydroxy-acid dehydratase [Bacillota bacterium]
GFLLDAVVHGYECQHLQHVHLGGFVLTGSGPIALVEEGDLIHLDVEKRILEIVGIAGEEKTPEEIAAVLEERKKNWQPKPVKYPKGMLRMFAKLAASPMKGAYLDLD